MEKLSFFRESLTFCFVGQLRNFYCKGSEIYVRSTTDEARNVVVFSAHLS